MKLERKKSRILIWIYCTFLLTFNEFLGIFLSKSIFRGLYAALFILIIIKKLISKKWVISLKRSTDKIVIIYFLYILFRYILQIMFGKTSSITSLSFVQTFLPILAYFLAKDLSLDETGKIESIFCIFASISILLGLIDSYIHFLPDVGSFEGGLYANIGTSVYTRSYSLAGNALITGFIGTLSICFANSLQNKPLRYTSILIGLYGVLGSLSRGAFSMLLIYLVSYLVCKFIKNKQQINKRKLFSIVIISLIFIIALITNYNRIISSPFFGRFIKVGISINDGSNKIRSNFQNNAISVISKSPIFGIGFGFAGYQAILNNVNSAINTESYILSLTISTGLIGSILFLLIALKSIIESLKNIDHNNNYKYGCIIMGIIFWSFMYIILESDLNAIFYWYCICRSFGIIKK